MFKSEKIVLISLISLVVGFSACQKEELVSPSNGNSSANTSADAVNSYKKGSLEEQSSSLDKNTNSSIVGGGSDDNGKEKGTKGGKIQFSDSGNNTGDEGSNNRSGEGDKGTKHSTTSSDGGNGK